MGGRAGLRGLLQFDRFGDEELEARFQQEYRQPTIDACHLWAVVATVVLLTNMGAAVAYHSMSSTYWCLCSIHVCCVAVTLGVARSSSIMARRSVALPAVDRLRDTLCGCYCLCLAAFGAQQCLSLHYCLQQGWFLPPMGAQVADFFNGCMTFLFMLYFYIFQQLLTLPLLQIGFCPAFVLSIFCGPMVYVLMASVGVPVRKSPFFFLPASFLILGVQVFYCRRLAVLRRSVFVLELQKARHTQEIRDVDAAINHIVKNTMAEAAGLTEMFLDLCTPPPPADFVQPYLHEALERLRSGMAWCKRRRVLTELLDAEARQVRVPTSLTALGRALASHRTMTTDFADVQVELDEALTDLLLENVINNAFRHGHPTNPAVHFCIVADHPDAAGACAVTFRVTNRSDPSRQPLMPDLLEELRRTVHSDLTRPTPCGGLGLRHCLLAAELQGMAISLMQEGDLVVFQASVVTQVVPRSPSRASPTARGPSGAAPALPGTDPPPLFGLRISLIDDSASARTLLRHQLRHDIPGCVVDVFGASAADVEPFLRHTVATADIAILDQHLDWPSGDPGLGTNLVKLLLGAGFCGMICIRSANTSDLDTQHYFAVGAHCVLDKLLDRAQTTATLTAHYRHFLSGAPEPLTSTPGGPLVVTLPGFVSVA